MINVSPIGRACSQTERDAFEQHDKTANVRPKMVEHLKVSRNNIDLSGMDYHCWRWYKDRIIFVKDTVGLRGHLPILQ